MHTFRYSRVKAYIVYGGAQSTDASQPCTSTQGSCDTLAFPENGWEDIRKATPSSPFEFGLSQIVAYFVTRSVSDGKVAGDLKSINKSAENLFICGHIQSVQCVEVNKIIYVKAKCLPEMRKDRVYLLKVAIKSEESDILYAECGCPAGMGPRGSCKHIAALAYALVDFSRCKRLPEYHTSTDMLQQWNRPRQRHVDIIPVAELGSHRRHLTSSVRLYGSGVVFDPRPTSLRDRDPSVALEKLRCDLLSLNQPCGLLNIIIPSVAKIDHDHCYHKAMDRQLDNLLVSANMDSSNCLGDSAFLELKQKTVTAEQVLEALHLTPEERLSLESDTRSQNTCSKWHEARRIRITGSKCARIISQKEKTVALLCFCLYPKPMIYLPKPIAWGRENEPKARSKYVEHMQTNGHLGLTTSDSGLVVHVEKCWLGATPDAWVTDPSVKDTNGIAEFKCPYREANMTLDEACQGSKFCCSMVDGILHLKRNHGYYHQVQLQLYVASDRCKWCDFCVHTTKDLAVERIYPDQEWVSNLCPQLDDYYFDHILPEVVAEEHKPSYFY